MKKTISFLLLLVSLTSIASASHTEMLDGEEAYKLYQSLPGVACQEYRLQNYIVFTKYQTKSCSVQQTDTSKWECTGQFAMKKGKITEVISVSCAREVK